MTGLPPCAHCGQHHNEDVLLCPTSEKLIPLAGRVLDGKFRFVKQLGEGGMGAVWEAENVLVKKTVAIKLMHVQFSKDEGVLSRFRNEATAAGRIGSKHICDILDLGRSQLGPYIVMEMLHGADFAGFMQQRTAVDPGTIAMVTRQALEGLQAAHAAGIVHRDLKPENIFLHEPSPGQLLVKLMDFGISKFTEGDMAGKTGMGVLMGTPEYMSPEQTEGAAQADHRTDIWAMGVILYWALAGRNPFMGATMASTLINVTTREPIAITQAVPGIDPGLAAVVERCLKKSPADRFESSEAMSAALEPFENLGGSFFVPFLSKSGSTGRGTSMPSTPPPGATVASMGPPQMRPPPGPPVPTPAPAPAGVPVPTPSSKSEDVMVLGAAGASAGPTFSSELSGVPAGASPTMASGGDWGAFGDDSDSRPDSNMGSGKGGFLVIALVALAVLAGGGYFAYTAMQEPDAKAVAASAAAKAEGQLAATKAEEEAAKAAEEAAAAVLPDVGSGDEAGDEAGESAEGGAVVAGAEGGAAEGGAAEGGAAEGGAAEGGAAEGGAAEGGAAEGGAAEGGAAEGGEEAKPSGGGTKPSGGGTKPSGGGTKPSGGGTKPSGGGSKKSGGGSKKSGGGSKPSGGGSTDSGNGSLKPSKPPREDTSAKKKKKKKGKKKKGKKKKGKKKTLTPGG